MSVKKEDVDAFVRDVLKQDPEDVLSWEAYPGVIVTHHPKRKSDGTVILDEFGPAQRHNHHYIRDE